MSWTRTLATGHGKLSWRVSIDGLPFDFVSAVSMEDSSDGQGRARYVGLRSSGFKLSERVHLPTASWEPDGMRIKIADVNRRATELFTKRPTAVTYLAADWTSGTTITVADTSAFASSGKAYIGFQSFDYLSTTATTFGGVSGQRFNTPPLKHYVGTGTRASNPEITDWPRSIEGRRVRLYVYGAGDDPQGDGTQVWVGTARTEPTYDGVEWSFSVDPLSGIFDGDLNANLEDPYTIRGIYYSFRDPLMMTIEELGDANRNTLTVSAKTYVLVCGFWETQEEFCADLTDHILDCVSNHPVTGTFTQQDVRAVPDGLGWRLQYTTTSAAKWLRIQGGPGSDVGILGAGIGGSGGGIGGGGASGGTVAYDGKPFSSMDGVPSTHWIAEDGEAVSTVSNSTTYTLPILTAGGVPEAYGTVPRASLGWGPYQSATAVSSVPADNRLNVSQATNPEGRLYLNDSPASGSTALITWAPNGQGTAEGALTPSITADTTTNYIDCTFVVTPPPLRVATSENPPEIRIGRALATGNLHDLLTALQNGSDDYVNQGVWPYIHGGSSSGASADIDLANSEPEIDAAAGSTPLGNGRTYTFFAPVSLRELIEHECRLIGVYPCYDGNGQIVFRRLRLPSPSEVGAVTLSSSNIVIRDNLLTYERCPHGLYNTIDLRVGYDPVEDESTAPLVRIRDVMAYSAAPQPRTLIIAPKSIDPPVPFSYADAVTIATRVLAVFGAPYQYLTVQVPLTMFDATLGSVVAVTWSKVPDGFGSLGVEERLGLVVGREWQPREGRGTLTIMLTDQRIGGYAPGGRITGAVTGASVTTGPFTVTLSADYFPSGSTAANFFEAGDAVRIFAWASQETAYNVTGTITAVTGNAVTFEADSAWEHDIGLDWALGAAVSTSITRENQKSFVYIARSTMRVHWGASDIDDAFTLA